MNSRWIPAAVVLAAAAGSAFAAGPNTTPAQSADHSKQATATQGSSVAEARSSAMKSFEELDQNHDGSVSMTEAAADKDVQSSFKQLDKNNDLKLSPSEFKARESSANSGKKPGS